MCLTRVLSVFLILVGLNFSLWGCSLSRVGDVKESQDLSGFSKKISLDAQVLYAKSYSLWRSYAVKKSGFNMICSDPAAAVELLDQVIALEPEYGPAYTRRGLAKSDQGELEEAFDDATIGIRLEPTPEAYAYRAFISLREHNIKAARRDLEYSIKLNSKQYLAWVILGAAALAEGNDNEACKAFNKACSYGDCAPLEQAKEEKICS